MKKTSIIELKHIDVSVSSNAMNVPKNLKVLVHLSWPIDFFQDNCAFYCMKIMKNYQCFYCWGIECKSGCKEKHCSST